MSKILVTGGNGYIPRKLPDKGPEAADRSPEGSPPQGHPRSLRRKGLRKARLHQGQSPGRGGP